MKAISVKQPWASLILKGIKDIENRNWFTNYRGQLYIHTGKKVDAQGADLVSKLYPQHKNLIEKSMKIRGGVIGSVDLIDCVTEHRSTWFHGEYGFVLKSPKKIEFYPLKGQLSIFDFEFNQCNEFAREVQLSLF